MYQPDDFICGGYFLVRRVLRPRGISPPVPEEFLTLSHCFTDIAPDDWALSGYDYDDEERAAAAAKFGIPATAVPNLVQFFSDQIGLQHNNAFPNLAVAEAFYSECNDQRVALLGIGLHPSLMESLLVQRVDEINHGYGLVERVELQVPLASGGEPLGFEPLGFEGTSFHSWLCHNAPAQAFKNFGIGLNSEGLIDSFEDALRVTRHLKSTGAEPGIWEPWLVVRYSSPRPTVDD